jgi:3'-phosphoadenosine 5'-phosphosulfate sulfotransferase (PAPS reductase)/FAD synthetase
VSVDRVAGRRVVVSLSGGKDSAAVALHLRELGVEFDLVFIDTGWEHPLTYEYVRGTLARALGPVVEIRGALSMEELVRRKGMFPSRFRRFCTDELKAAPMAAHLRRRIAAGERIVNAIGIRHEESAARAFALEWEFNGRFGCDVWAPIVRWTLDDVIAIHKRHGLAPNPLYLKGASRVGCWPCIYARKAELRLVAEIDPDRIDRLRTLEADVTTTQRDRYARDRAAWLATPDPEPEPGTPAHTRWTQKRDRLIKPFAAPSFFLARRSEDGDRFLPIDEAVAWARTARGGRQVELFAPTNADTGCMRWGMCEGITPPADGGAK